MEDNGNPGIDRDHERERLNYRPERYERRIVRGGILTGGDDEVLPVFPEDEDSTPVSRLDANIEALEELLSELKEKLEAENAGRKVVLEETGEEIDFQRYKEALDGNDVEDLIIREAWEEHAEDVDGDLASEFYEDVHEIEKELEAFLPFLEAHVYEPMGMKLKEASIEKEEAFMKEAQDFFKEVKESERERKRIILEHDLSKLSQIEDGMRLLRQEKAKIKEVLQVKTEVMEIAEEKLSRHYQTLATIEEALEEEYEDGMAYLQKRASVTQDEASYRHEVRAMKTLLKLSLDEENERKQSLKRFARGHLSMEKRKRLQMSLDGSLWLQKSLNSSLKEILLDEEDEPVMLGRLVSGASKVQDAMEEELLAFYQASRTDAEKRLEKVRLVQEKETTRNLYRNVDKRLKELGGDL